MLDNSQEIAEFRQRPLPSGWGQNVNKELEKDSCDFWGSIMVEGTLE